MAISYKNYNITKILDIVKSSDYQSPDLFQCVSKLME